MDIKLFDLNVYFAILSSLSLVALCLIFKPYKNNLYLRDKISIILFFSSIIKEWLAGGKHINYKLIDFYSTLHANIPSQSVEILS